MTGFDNYVQRAPTHSRSWHQSGVKGFNGISSMIQTITHRGSSLTQTSVIRSDIILNKLSYVFFPLIGSYLCRSVRHVSLPGQTRE